VHFPDSLLIPQNELNITCASIPELVGKREEGPARFLLQDEAILKETGIQKARRVTVLAPQLKTQAGTWWGTMRALDLPWQEFRSELLEKFNRDELHSSLQSELLSTAQTKTETLGGVRPTQVPVVSEVKPWSDRRSGGNDSDWTHA